MVRKTKKQRQRESEKKKQEERTLKIMKELKKQSTTSESVKRQC